MFFPIATGLIVGWWLAKRNIDHLLVLYYHIPFRKSDKYLQLYDMCDGEFTFKMMENLNKPPKNYAEFLKWHQLYRPKAAKIFIKFWSATLKQVRREYFLFLVLASIVFWRFWYYYLVAVIAVHIIYIAHRRLIKHNGVDFYAMAMLNTIIDDIRFSKR